MEIFDAYVEDLAAQEKAKEKKSTKAGAGKEEGKQKKVNAMDLQVRMYIKLKGLYEAIYIILFICNLHHDFACDYVYW